MKNLQRFFQSNISVIIIIASVLLFFYPVFSSLKIPIPADTIVGMFHPYRDVVWGEFTQGVPFKNFLITDPVRQQYPWRNLSIEAFKTKELPIWNPYSFSGTPLLANFQSAAFYPLNIVFFLMDFNTAWTILVMLQPLLGAIFFFSYVRSLNIKKEASLLGALAFAYSGFTIAWLEWNTVVHTLIWLPLILLSIERILTKATLKWAIILFVAELSCVFAGHLQILFYVVVFSIIYALLRVLYIVHKSKDDRKKIYVSAGVLGLITGIAIMVTAVQWAPTLEFISQSARDIDQGSYKKEGWFIPSENLVQFFAPDFFGNPATANYWGKWNYGEFIGYIGIVPLIFALYALIFRRDKKTLFFGSFFFITMLFALESFIGKLPYELNVPFLKTSQPTRLLSISIFSLIMLTSLGFDQFLTEDVKTKKLRNILLTIGIIALTGLVTWMIVLLREIVFPIELITNLGVSQRNLIFPSIVFILSSFLIVSVAIIQNKKIKVFVIYCLVILTVIDLFRFGWKFTSFSEKTWIYPKTRALEYLQKNIKNYRFLSLDRRIMPPNFSTMYKLQDVSGYDPLYLRKYGELVAAWERGKPDISNASFNRIITPTNISSPITDLLGVGYILSIDEINNSAFDLVFKEGETKVYKNKNTIPRVFLVSKIIKAKNDQDEMNKLFENIQSLSKIATTQEDIRIADTPIEKNEYTKIIKYSENKVKIETNTTVERLLIFTDIYYPMWKADIDGSETKIYSVDFTFRGLVVPKGQHIIEFEAK